MEVQLVKVSPNRMKARSMLRMARVTMDMIRTINAEKFPSNVVKEYYDAIHELISAILLLDGFKTYGEGAHALAIEYIGKNYSVFNSLEISLMDDMRDKRNKITYDGFFVNFDYISRKRSSIESIIEKLMGIIESRL